MKKGQQLYFSIYTIGGFRCYCVSSNKDEVKGGAPVSKSIQFDSMAAENIERCWREEAALFESIEVDYQGGE